MWTCQRSAYFKFIPHTHTHTPHHTTRAHTQNVHTHTHILIPFEDRESTALKVDIANDMTITLSEDATDAQREDLVKETQLLSQIPKHNNIVTFLGFTVASGKG